MEQIMSFLSEQHWVVIALAIFAFAGHTINALISFLDGLEGFLKAMGKKAGWIDKTTNALAVVAKWINKILNIVNANKKK